MTVVYLSFRSQTQELSERRPLWLHWDFVMLLFDCIVDSECRTLTSDVNTVNTYVFSKGMIFELHKYELSQYFAPISKSKVFFYAVYERY